MKVTKKIMAIFAMCLMCGGFAVLQKESNVNDAKAWAAVSSYHLNLKTKEANFAAGVAGTYVSSCASVAAGFVWGGPAGLAAGVLVGL